MKAVKGGGIVNRGLKEELSWRAQANWTSEMAGGVDPRSPHRGEPREEALHGTGGATYEVISGSLNQSCSPKIFPDDPSALPFHHSFSLMVAHLGGKGRHLGRVRAAGGSRGMSANGHAGLAGVRLSAQQFLSLSPAAL